MFTLEIGNRKHETREELRTLEEAKRVAATLVDITSTTPGPRIAGVRIICGNREVAYVKAPLIAA